eukprot:scaffold78883_cov62-Phaeocystis_antarctica.AAC.6
MVKLPSRGPKAYRPSSSRTVPGTACAPASHWAHRAARSMLWSATLASSRDRHTFEIAHT